jgi:hypothetical protein
MLSRDNRGWLVVTQIFGIYFLNLQTYYVIKRLKFTFTFCENNQMAGFIDSSKNQKWFLVPRSRCRWCDMWGFSKWKCEDTWLHVNTWKIYFDRYTHAKPWFVTHQTMNVKNNLDEVKKSCSNLLKIFNIQTWLFGNRNWNFESKNFWRNSKTYRDQAGIHYLYSYSNCLTITVSMERTALTRKQAAKEQSKTAITYFESKWES